MKYLALLLLVACEKSGPVEATPGSSNTSGPEPTKVIVVDASVATLPNDATMPNDAAKLAVVDAAVKPLPKPSDDRQRAAMEESALAMANLMTADDNSTGDMTTRRPGADLGRQLDEVRDSGKVAVGGGTGRAGVGRVPALDPPTAVDKGPVGRIAVSKKQAFDDTSLTVDLVLAKIRSAYMSGIKRCYVSYLKMDPSARGKLALSFTVNETGRTVTPKAKGFASEIDSCISGMMASWRFPIPKDNDGEATDGSFGIDLQLVPD